jgi:sulfate transport system permease protein
LRGPAGRPARKVVKAVGGGDNPLTLGLVVLYLSLIVLIPLAAVAVKGVSSGLGTFWSSVTNTLSLRALGVTLVMSLIVAAIGAVMGTLVAWVLVRDRFPGQRLLGTLIDLPFALPSIVAGLTLIALYGPDSPVGINIAYTRGSTLLALLFVALPFGVRSVQPVLMELDLEAEEAAASLGAGSTTIFRRIILPALTPAIISGAALAFARSVGEFGALALIAGKVPIASIVIYDDIEGGDTQSAAALSLVLMIISLIMLVAIRRTGGRVAR